MRVNKIFYSIQGEGSIVGVPTVFIRLQGCNLRCNWCDTVYAQDPNGGEEMTAAQVANAVLEMMPYQKRWVCITGGEPLLHTEELRTLTRALKHRNGCLIEIETNGSFPPPPWFSLIDSWVADIKCPSSGFCGVGKVDGWFALRRKDQVKFVVGSAEDLNFVRRVLREKLCIPTVLVSPVAGILVDKTNCTIEEYWNREWLQEVVEFCKEMNARFSLQVQKVVWGDKQGV